MDVKKYFLAGILILFTFSVFAQNQDAVLGKWESEHGGGQIQIYKTGNKYFGKIIWIREPNDNNGKPKRDINNPSEKLRSQPIIGLDVLKNFTYEGNNVWNNGTVYDPKSGKTYSCKMTLISNNKLNIRGYVGFSFIGKSETWTRVP
jgi:uncharacterized protein (DUF2147 family)